MIVPGRRVTMLDEHRYQLGACHRAGRARRRRARRCRRQRALRRSRRPRPQRIARRRPVAPRAATTPATAIAANARDACLARIWPRTARSTNRDPRRQRENWKSRPEGRRGTNQQENNKRHDEYTYSISRRSDESKTIEWDRLEADMKAQQQRRTGQRAHGPKGARTEGRTDRRAHDRTTHVPNDARPERRTSRTTHVPKRTPHDARPNDARPERRQDARRTTRRPNDALHPRSAARAVRHLRPFGACGVWRVRCSARAVFGACGVWRVRCLARAVFGTCAVRHLRRLVLAQFELPCERQSSPLSNDLACECRPCRSRQLDSEILPEHRRVAGHEHRLEVTRTRLHEIGRRGALPSRPAPRSACRAGRGSPRATDHEWSRRGAPTVRSRPRLAR